MSIFQLSNSFQKIVIYIAPNASFFSLKCTKIVGGWGSAPDPAGGAYSAPPDPLAVMGWDGNLGKFRPPQMNFLDPPLLQLASVDPTATSAASGNVPRQAFGHLLARQKGGDLSNVDLLALKVDNTLMRSLSQWLSKYDIQLPSTLVEKIDQLELCPDDAKDGLPRECRLSEVITTPLKQYESDTHHTLGWFLWVLLWV